MFADKFGLETTSAGAGALWRPVFIADTPPEDATRWADATLGFLDRMMQKHGTNKTGLKWVTGCELFATEKDNDPIPQPPYWGKCLPFFRGMTTDELQEFTKRNGRRYTHGFRFKSMMINSPKYLTWLAGEIERLGGTLQKRKITAADVDGNGLFREGFTHVLNCAGLCGPTLTSDDDLEMVPMRGQTIQVRVEDPMIEEFVVDLSDSENDLVYVLPRDDGGVVMGGTKDHSNSDAIDQATIDRIWSRGVALKPELRRKCPSFGLKHWVGFRPQRARVRVERSSNSRGGGVVVHNYGHGGCGLTLHHGCALDAIELLFGSEGKRSRL